MSDEPRIRLEDSGTVVSEYWYDQSTGETVVESESGETYRFANDGTLDTPALNTDKLNNAIVVDPSEGTAGIQQAHDDLPSDGGMIILERGRYEVNNYDVSPWDDPAFHVTKDNIALIGQGKATEIFLPDDAARKTSDGANVDEGARIIHVGGQGNDDHTGTGQADGFHISNLTINGNRQNNQPIGDPKDGHNLQIQGSDAVVRGIWSINSVGDGVEPISRTTDSNGDPQSKNVTIVNNVFRDCEEQHIHIHGVKGFSVAGNVCEGEYMGGCFTLFSHKADNINGTITGNVFRNGDFNGATLSADPSNPYVARNITFVGNVIEDVGGSGIYINSGSEDVTIADNIVDGALRGLYVNGGSDFRVHGNVFKNTAQRGVFGIDDQGAISDLTIEQNEFREVNQNEVGASFFKFELSGTAFDRVSVEGNKLLNEGSTNADKGIWFIDSGSGTYSDVVVQDNYLSGMQRPWLGVHDELSGAPVVTVSENNGFKTEGYGSASASDGDTISHGLRVAPPIELCQVSTTSSNRAYVTATDNSNLTVALEDPSGAAVTTDETVYWKAHAKSGNTS